MLGGICFFATQCSNSSSSCSNRVVVVVEEEEKAVDMGVSTELLKLVLFFYGWLVSISSLCASSPCLS